jgi:hypothetical protein
VHNIAIVLSRLCYYRQSLRVTPFIDHFTSRHGTTSNFSAITYLHSLQITTTNTISSPPCNVFTSRFLVTASNSGDSSASALTPFPALHYLATQLLYKLVPLIALWHDHVEIYFLSLRACLPRSCVATVAARATENIALLLCACFLPLVPGSGRCLQSYSLATGLHATVYFNGTHNLRFGLLIKVRHYEENFFACATTLCRF